MPPLKQIRTLIELSQAGLVTYLSEVWLGNTEDWVVSILRRISYIHLHQILQLLVKRERATAAHVSLLLDERLKQFDFSGRGLGVFDNDVFMLRLVNTCPHLTMLSAPCHARVRSSTWREMLRQLPHLTRLNLTGTSCDDKVLQELCTSCPELEQLAIADTEITDAGLHHLAQSSTLKTLDISCCRVSTVAVGEVLQKLHMLQDLETDYLCLVIERLHPHYKRGDIVPQDQQYNLQTGTVTILGEVANHIWTLCAFCPKLKDVQIYGNVYDGCLKSLTTLNCIQKLHIENDDLQCSRHSISDLLEIVGSSLKELSLLEYDVNVLCDVIKNCKLLQEFVFQAVPNPVLDMSQYVHHYDTLSQLNGLELSISSRDDFTIDEKTLVVILSHCTNLGILSMERIVNLTDDVIMQVTKNHGLVNLHKIALQQCPAVSGVGLWYLLENSAFLTRIYLTGCSLMSAYQVAQLEHEADNRRWDLRIYRSR